MIKKLLAILIACAMLAGFATVSAGANETTTIDLGSFTWVNNANQSGWHADGFEEGNGEIMNGAASVEEWQTAEYLVIELAEKLEGAGFQIVWQGADADGAGGGNWNQSDFAVDDYLVGDMLVFELSKALRDYDVFVTRAQVKVLIAYYDDDVVNIVNRAYLVFGELDLGDNGGGNNNPGIGGDGNNNSGIGVDGDRRPALEPIHTSNISTPVAPFEIEGIILPANSIVITFDTHGEFGFDFAVVISAEQLAEAGLDAEKVKLWYISDKNEISEVKDAIVVNADGSITITVSHASYYVLAETAPVVDENPPTGVAVSFAAVLIAGGIAAVTRKRR
jgi:hypothetical protein